MIPEDVKALIQSSIHSVWTLEVLLLMRRGADRSWNGAELSRELRGSGLVSASALRELTAAGLVLEEAPGIFRYNPVRAELGAVVDKLEHAYRETPFAVTQAILASPNQHIRTFAEAFRLKKDRHQE